MSLSEILRTCVLQPLKRVRGVRFRLKLSLHPYIVWENIEGSCENASLRILAWVFPGRICNKYLFSFGWLISWYFSFLLILWLLAVLVICLMSDEPRFILHLLYYAGIGWNNVGWANFLLFIGTTWNNCHCIWVISWENVSSRICNCAR